MKINFNCVDMKHKSAEIIQEKISRFTLNEELKYWENKSNELELKKEKIMNSKK